MPHPSLPVVEVCTHGLFLFAGDKRRREVDSDEQPDPKRQRLESTPPGHLIVTAAPGSAIDYTSCLSPFSAAEGRGVNRGRAGGERRSFLFVGIPVEIWAIILSLLKIVPLVRLAQVNKAFRRMAYDNLLWSNNCKIVFGQDLAKHKVNFPFQLTHVAPVGRRGGGGGSCSPVQAPVPGLSLSFGAWRASFIDCYFSVRGHGSICLSMFIVSFAPSARTQRGARWPFANALASNIRLKT
jgi:hypothetical protein